jgi:hypothetical protein
MARPSGDLDSLMTEATEARVAAVRPDVAGPASISAVFSTATQLLGAPAAMRHADSTLVPLSD